MKNVALMAIPALAAFVISVIAGKIIVPALAKAKMRQYEREEGPESHKKKQGTPTMGGVIFLLATLIVSLFYIGKYPEMIPVMIGMFGFGLIGLIDDSMKMLKKQNEGMTPSRENAWSDCGSSGSCTLSAAGYEDWYRNSHSICKWNIQCWHFLLCDCGNYDSGNC